MKITRFFVDKLPAFDSKQVECVYVGEPDTCMCGCSGKYTYLSTSQKQAGLNRGYAVTDDEVNDTRAEHLINEFRVSHNLENIDNKIFTIIRHGKQYTLYFLEPLKEKVEL